MQDDDGWLVFYSDHESALAAAQADLTRLMEAIGPGLTLEQCIEEISSMRRMLAEPHEFVLAAAWAELTKARRERDEALAGLMLARQRFESFADHAEDSGWKSTAEEFRRFARECEPITPPAPPAARPPDPPITPPA